MKIKETSKALAWYLLESCAWILLCCSVFLLFSSCIGIDLMCFQYMYIYVLLNLKGLIFNLAICFLRKRSVEATPHGNICSITCCVWDSNIHHHRDHPHADGKHSIQPYNPATIVDPPPYTPKDSNQNENTYFGRFRGYLRNKFSNR